MTVTVFQMQGQRKASEDAGNCFPVDAVSIWKTFVNGIGDSLANRSIRIVEKFESEVMMVVANPLLLDRVFGTAVQFLLDNALDDSEVRVDFKLTAAGVNCHFNNEGGGTPIETLRRSLQADENNGSGKTKNSNNASAGNLTTAQSDQLTEIEEWIVSWGGKVSVESHPHSMSVTIDLLHRSTMPKIGTPRPDGTRSGS